MRSHFLPLFFLYLSIFQSPAQAWEWDILDLGNNIGRMKAAMNELADKILAGEGVLLEKAAVAVNDIIDKLFDDKFVKLLASIQAMIEKNLRQITEDIQQIIDNLFQKISDTINQIADRAKELIDSTIEEIKAKIIDEFFTKIDNLVATITANVLRILDKIDDMIYKLSCSEQALADKLIKAVVDALPSIPNPFNSCREAIDKKFPGFNLRWKFFSSYTANQLYEYKKCDYFINLDEKSPIASILMAYRDLEALAGDMRCAAVALRLTENLFYYMDEMATCVKMADFWQHI